MGSSTSVSENSIGSPIVVPDQNATNPVFLQCLRWSALAPPLLVQAAECGDVDAFAREIAQRLANPGGVLSPGKGSPLNGKVATPPVRPVLWKTLLPALTPSVDLLLSTISGDRPDFPSRTRRVADRSAAPLAAAGAMRVSGKKGGVSRRGDAGDLGIVKSPAWAESATPQDLVAVLEGLPLCASRVPSEAFLVLWRTTLCAVHAALDGTRLLAETAGGRPDEALVRLGELPWIAGLVLADLEGADVLRQRGCAVLNRELLQQTDDDGVPHAALTERLPLWLAVLVRAGKAGAMFRAPLWSGPGRRRMASLMTQVTQLLSADGELPFCGDLAVRPQLLLDAARDSLASEGASRSSLSPNGKPASGSANGLGRSASGAGRTTMPASDLTDDPQLGSPAFESDASCLACLRNDRAASTDRLTVAWHGAVPQIELWVLGRPLLRGGWDLEISVDDRPVPVAGKWECVCWNSDSEGDYLELQCRVTDHLRVERQMLLSRGEGFLLLADAVSGAQGERIAYATHLPLAAGLETRAELDTREWRVLPRPAARLFPLGLPQKRVVNAAGAFGLVDGRFELRQSGWGSGLYAPLMIDWDPSRRQAAADWRTLTVTEEGAVLAHDHAAGHRLRIGRQQWLVYRSLVKSTEARAVLGHNTRYESVIGTFGPDGEVEPILLIE